MKSMFMLFFVVKVLFLFLKENLKRVLFYSKDGILDEKLSCRRKGHTEIGIVIVAFYLFLIILLPISLVIQELTVFYHSNGAVKMATELSMFDLVFHLNQEAMSQSDLVFEHDLRPLFIESFYENQDMLEDIENLVIQKIERNGRASICASFEYNYVSKVIMKNKLSKLVYVYLEYELPLNN